MWKSLWGEGNYREWQQKNSLHASPLLHQPSEGKKKKKGGPKGIKKKEAAGSGGKVTIMRMSRNKRKSITVITGLDTYPGKGGRREGGRGWEERRFCVCLDPEN